MASGPDDITGPRLRIMQIIAFALVFGVVSFLAIAMFMVYGQNNGQGMSPPQDLPMISLVAAALLAVNFPLAIVLPGLQTRTALRQIATGNPSSDVGSLLTLRQTTLIISMALLEGAAFMGAMAFLLEAHAIALVVVGAAVGSMLAFFPTRNRVQAWLDRQASALQELRTTGQG